MTKYTIHNLELETVMVKNADEMKKWVKKFNVKMANGHELDLRKFGADLRMVNVNGKMLYVGKRVSVAR